MLDPTEYLYITLCDFLSLLLAGIHPLLGHPKSPNASAVLKPFFPLTKLLAISSFRSGDTHLRNIVFVEVL
jgi:hypothetical protein